jgi:hypothetical protein
MEELSNDELVELRELLLQFIDSLEASKVSEEK